MTKKRKTSLRINLQLCACNLTIAVQQLALHKGGGIQKIAPYLMANNYASFQKSTQDFTHAAQHLEHLYLRYSRDLGENSARFPYGIAQKEPYALGANLEQSQISLLRSQFVNMLMKGGEKSHAYQILLASINTCKFKLLEKRVLLMSHLRVMGLPSTEAQCPAHGKHAHTKGYDVAPSKENKSKTSDTQRVRSNNLYRLHTNVQAIGTNKPALLLESAVGLRRQGKKCLQSNQICGKTVYNVEPVVETRKVRVRGSTYQVPSTLYSRRGRRMAIRWILVNAYSKRQSNKKALSVCLGQEFFDCINKQSVSIQKRDQVYRLAVNSRVYTRYKWW